MCTREHTWELDGNGLSSHILPGPWSVGVRSWCRWAHGRSANGAAPGAHSDRCLIIAWTGESCFVVQKLADCTDGREGARRLPPDAPIQTHHPLLLRSREECGPTIKKTKRFLF